MKADDPRHGTNAGYRAHYKWDTPTCQPCRAAHAAQHRRFKARKYLSRVDHLLVDPTPTIRRVRALQAMGWPLREIEVRLGKSGDGNGLWNMLHSPTIRIDSAAQVAAVYDRLHMKVGPSQRSRQIAARRGWPPPMAWDDIDDLNEEPKGMVA